MTACCVRRQLTRRIGNKQPMKPTFENRLSLLRHIISLENAVGSFVSKQPFVLPEYYHPANANQITPNVILLQRLASDMAKFIKLPFFTITVIPEKQKQSVGGHIEGMNPNVQEVFIAIEPDFLRFPMVTVKVMAHELSHKFLAFHHLSLESTEDDEILTDVTAIYLGFGTFALNGLMYTETYQKDFQTKVTRTVSNGYLDLDESAFVYDIVCRMRGFSNPMIFSDLDHSAVESILRVRRKYRKIYPPDKLDVSPIKKKIASIHSNLELSELALCNIDKIKMLFSGALASKHSEIELVSKGIVQTRNALSQIETAIDSPIGIVTYPSIPVWTEDVNKLANSSASILTETQSLNGFVSTRVPPDVTKANWDILESLITDCPKCAGKLRLPIGKTNMVVTCPKCRYSFDYSTTCPEFKWVPPAPFKEKKYSVFKSGFVKIKRLFSRTRNG